MQSPPCRPSGRLAPLALVAALAGVAGCATQPQQVAQQPSGLPQSRALAQVWSGPGKTEAEFQDDLAQCAPVQYSPQLYVECAVGHGDSIRNPEDGQLYVPPAGPGGYSSPQQPYATEIPAEPPAPEPPPAPADSTEQASVTSPPLRPLTDDEESKLILDGGIQFGLAYGACRNDESRGQCTAMRFVRGMGPDARDILCNHQDLLQRILGTHTDLENLVVSTLACAIQE